MTDEQWWRTCTDPEEMLEHLNGRASERKLRLFACACIRRHWHALPDPRICRAIEVAELYGDGLASEIDRSDAWDEVSSVSVPLSGARLAMAAVLAIEADAEYTSGDRVKVDIVRELIRLIPSTESARGPERAAQCALLRCLFGPRPFATPPRVPDLIRLWGDRTVPGLARTIYEEHAFDLLGILADALEEAGCADAIILDHLRGPEPHGRGCFALDACLLP
jgi:hypothetical protein